MMMLFNTIMYFGKYLFYETNKCLIQDKFCQNKRFLQESAGYPFL